MTMQAGVYYVGDLCYVMHEVWDEVCCIMFHPERNRKQGEFTLSDGRRFAVYPTTYGDGCYRDEFGNSYSVDAGIIGCILLSDIDTNVKASWGAVNSTEGGQIITFDFDFTTGKNEHGVIEFGHIVIDTESESEYDGQPDETQEWFDFDPDC